MILLTWLVSHSFPLQRGVSELTENTHILGIFLRDVMRNNMTRFRVFCPDETASNRLTSIDEATPKTWMAGIKPEDADGSDLSPEGAERH